MTFSNTLTPSIAGYTGNIVDVDGGVFVAVPEQDFSLNLNSTLASVSQGNKLVKLCHTKSSNYYYCGLIIPGLDFRLGLAIGYFE